MGNKTILQGKSVVTCSPSLALIKYWGKVSRETNLPATSSIALTLNEMRTETRVFVLKGLAIPKDLVFVNGKEQDPQRYQSYFDGIRSHLGSSYNFWAESVNSFPTASGLASSSSGFAALTMGIVQALGTQVTKETLSSMARLGSASAARSLFGGFTILPAGHESAQELYPGNYWPDLRVIVVRVREDAKETSSRTAMELSRTSSPYYQSWVEDSKVIVDKARIALQDKDISILGPLMRNSYLRMFGTMISSDPPILYWLPDSVAVIRLCAELRTMGIQAWETMDAGPQVKIFCLSKDVSTILQGLSDRVPHLGTLVDQGGDGPSVLSSPVLTKNLSPGLAEALKTNGIDPHGT